MVRITPPILSENDEVWLNYENHTIFWLRWTGALMCNVARLYGSLRHDITRSTTMVNANKRLQLDLSTTPHSLHYVSYGDPLWVFVTKMHSYNWTTLYGILLILKICFSKDDDFIKWKHFLRYWPFVQANHRSPVNSPHKGQWLGTLMFFLICAWIKVWVNNRDAGDLRRHRVLYDVTLMKLLGIHDIPILHGVISWWYITALHDI